mmetsp:Transcript_31675/g.57322  ORF Transcript_31675/g.57322 Transcript_31675/m.57322 type:complete len:600 (-) Transcript_31675:437-2236(-)
MADGVAPGAQIAFGDIGDSNGALSLPLDFQLLAVGRQNCQGNCAHIHSASWGSELNFYTTQARNFDQFMYDNDDFLILIAAGNSGHGDAPNTVGSPATGKNIIAVGAHHNTDTSRTDRGLGPSYIADFSSRGPTSDGRTKPDLMAPGKAVLSAGALPDQVGECDPDSRPGANSKKDGVLSLQGTSMATPVVSGTAAIIRQYFEQGYYPTGMKNETNIYDNPSGALIKAVLMNGAQFLKGVDNGSNGVTEIKPYDNNQNFGRLALQHSLYLPGKTDVQLNVLSDRKTVQDQRSQKAVIKIDKSDGCAYEKLSVTLIWVEPGSSPGCTKCVLNDLDLSVELGGITHYPNNLGRPDRHNNAERVIISGVNHGDEATITVEGYNLMQNEQQYSLVATGCFGPAMGPAAPTPAMEPAATTPAVAVPAGPAQSVPTPIQTFRPTSSPPTKKPTVAPSVQKTPTSSPAPSTNLRYCGLGLEDAQNRCVKAIPCPDGRNDNCLKGQTCFLIQMRICDTAGSATTPGIFSPSASPTNAPSITSTESPTKKPTNKPILQIPNWYYDFGTDDGVGEVDGVQNYSSASLHSYSMAVVLGTIAVGGTLYLFV